ncbi:MAG TPA: chalcone isomerase family protein [Planctomycetota bacterium]|nr:chalcone isomerase family protein [Planctomycetota bacterium]
MSALLLVLPFWTQDPPAPAPKPAPPKPEASKPKVPPRKIEWVKESDTGVKFPDAIQAKPGAGYQTLAGVGVRDKRFVILVNVYAYGLYLDETAIEEHLSDFFARPTKELVKDAKFFEALRSDAIGKTLRLAFVRDVGAKKIRNAFVESVEPRLETAEKKFGWTDGAKALETFRGYFASEIQDGEQIEFAWLPGNKLVTTVAGERKGEITSKALCWALWDTYYGDDPIETSGKKTTVERLADLLSKKPKPQPKPAPKPVEPPAPNKDGKAARR